MTPEQASRLTLAEQHEWYRRLASRRTLLRGGVAGAGALAYYSFVYGNVGIVSLDANDVSFEIPANNGYTGGAQVAWLGATLASLRSVGDQLRQRGRRRDRHRDGDVVADPLHRVLPAGDGQ